MRYLTTAFAMGALRRGRQIEQFLGPCEADGRAGVRWIEIVPAGGAYEVVLHEMLDLDEIADVYEFPDLVVHDEEYFGEILGMADDEADAMALAARHGAEDGRWVNQGVVGVEYHDMVRARHWGSLRPEDLASLVLRIDFCDDSGWEALRIAIDRYAPQHATFVSDPVYADCTVSDLVSAENAVAEEQKLTYVFLADAVSMAAEHLLLAVDLHDEPGRSFRVPPNRFADVSANLAIGNLNFRDFAELADDSGTYRG
jgi:hypothetical protein